MGSWRQRFEGNFLSIKKRDRYEEVDSVVKNKALIDEKLIERFTNK